MSLTLDFREPKKQKYLILLGALILWVRKVHVTKAAGESDKIIGA